MQLQGERHDALGVTGAKRVVNSGWMMRCEDVSKAQKVSDVSKPGSKPEEERKRPSELVRIRRRALKGSKRVGRIQNARNG